MTDSAVIPTLDELIARAKAQFAEIAELDDAKAKIDEAYERAKAAKVISLGTTLNQIKRTLPHGGWYPWLKSNFDKKPRSVQTYMAIAEKFANAQPVTHFGYSQLLQLLPLSSDELPAFLTAMETAGISAAGLSKRALGEHVKHWRKSHSLPTAQPVTIDVTAADSGTVAVEDMDDGTITATDASAIDVPVAKPVKFVAVQPPPPRYEQLSLFANLPALPAPPRYELPDEIVDVAEKISTPIFLIERHDAGTDFAEPVILVVTSPLARWVDSLRTKATATITTRLPMIRAGVVKVKPVLILYLGTDVETFARTFATFGGAWISLRTQKSSAATNNEALL